jgi:hypothetical protein
MATACVAASEAAPQAAHCSIQVARVFAQYGAQSAWATDVILKRNRRSAAIPPAVIRNRSLDVLNAASACHLEIDRAFVIFQRPMPMTRTYAG